MPDTEVYTTAAALFAAAHKFAQALEAAGLEDEGKVVEATFERKPEGKAGHRLLVAATDYRRVMSS